MLLVVSDEGLVSRLDADGGNVTTWSTGGDLDLEAITIADPQSDLVYLGREHPDGVLEFDLATGTLTGNSWDLTPWMKGATSFGLEALTYVDGLFYAGHQGEGNIYVFRLLGGGVVEPIEVFAAPFGRDDLSGLHYDTCTQTLYAIHDDFDVVVELELDGSFIREFDLPGVDQEGIAVVPDCDGAQSRIFVSEDSQAVWRYELYPVTLQPGVALALLGALLLLGGLSYLRSRG